MSVSVIKPVSVLCVGMLKFSQTFSAELWRHIDFQNGGRRVTGFGFDDANHMRWLISLCNPNLDEIYKSTADVHCVSKNIPDVFSYNSWQHCRAEILLRKQAIKRCPRHLINASALLCETENMEIVSFHVNVSCWLTNRHTSHVGIII